ncbi:hypothetical protein [Lacipirellula parvula]|uniref:Uncharacterized protein n=1 Tax=Lacipirellula parvula TaxID=2650471 RepID=A0A5K7XNF2_9BACT|nr:hypothetical protein [Lacipirellula parvula]BBO34669.1 hypothetical protein PLANPX_4281 [Lacipirellula parvula]
MSLLADFVARTLQTAAPATAATTAAVAACGALENDSSAAPVNAVSHIAWGDEAAEHDELSAKYTLTGAALNAAAITSWAAVYELGFGRAARNGNVSRALLGGVATAAAAYVVDYHVVPRRLTPGFEKRLSSPSMFAAYAALAASLPLASLMRSKQR